MKWAATIVWIALAACSGEVGDDDDDDNGCVPAPDAVWLEEGERLELPIDCGVATIAPLPDGATYDPGAAVLDWTPRLDQAGVYRLQVGDAHELKVGVADAWEDPLNTPVLDPLTYTEEYGLPVLFLSQAPTGSNAFTPVSITYGGHVYEYAEGKIRGGVSQNYPKNSYTLRFHSADLFNEPSRSGGFLGKRKIVLTSTFDDNSYIRQRLSFDLWNALDPDNVQIQTYNAVVYLEGEYWGLYVLGDHVDKHLMAQHGLSDDGNVYKAVNHDANFRLTDAGGDAKNTLHDGYEKKDGEPSDDFSDMEDLVTFAATATSPVFLAEVDTRLRRADYENWFILVTAIMADDSAGKNSYHYHDPLGGPWRFAPWDFNACFGQNWRTQRQGSGGERTYLWSNRLFERFLAEPTIADPLVARYARVLNEQYDVDAVLALVDAYAAEIDISARRDQTKWGDTYRSYSGWNNRDDFTDYDGELDYVRSWIAQRWSYLQTIYPE